KKATNHNDSVVTIGLTQMACSPDFRTNLKNQLHLAEQAAKAGARIICTQELFGSQYFCQVEDHRFFKLAETIPGPSTDAFSKLAKKYRAVVIASDRKSTRLNSSHVSISYAVFCLKKK